MFFTINSFKTFVAADVGGYRNQNPNMWHQTWIERVLFSCGRADASGCTETDSHELLSGSQSGGCQGFETIKALSVLFYWS